MAQTTNYGWPLPNPLAIQIVETGKIATSLIAIDLKMKATETALSNHKHKFADLTELPTTLAGYGIEDAMTADQVAEAIRDAISALIGGATPEALDTLAELAKALGDDPDFAANVSNALGLRVRVDAATNFTATQKARGRLNLDALGTPDKGKAGGVATLGDDGKVPSTQLPALDYLPLAGGTLTGGLAVVTSLRVRGAGNTHLWFEASDGTERGVVWLDSASGSLHVRIGGQVYQFQTNGQFWSAGDVVSRGAVYAGSGSGQLQTNGNVVGSIWGNYGYSNDAYTAITNRIEQRANEFSATRRDEAINWAAGNCLVRGGTDMPVGVEGVGATNLIFRGGGANYHACYFTINSGVYRGSVLVTASGTQYTSASDYRLKPIVEPLNNFQIGGDQFPELDNSLLRVLAWRPVRHNWDHAPEEFTHGFIAHELQAVSPHAVTGEKDAVEDIGTAVVAGAVIPAFTRIEMQEVDGEKIAVEVVIPEEQLPDEVYEDVPQSRYPDAKSWAKTGERPVYQGVDPSKLVPELAAAVQSLTLMVLEQRKEIAILKEQVASL